RREFRLAVEAGKVVIPVSIDKTPLPSELGEFQGLDLSGEISHDKTRVWSPRVVLSAVAITIGILGYIIRYLIFRIEEWVKAVIGGMNAGYQDPAPPPVNQTAEWTSEGVICVLFVLAGMAIVFLVTYRHVAGVMIRRKLGRQQGAL